MESRRSDEHRRRRRLCISGKADSMTGQSIFPGDRATFDGRRISWLARADSEDGRYTLLTSAMFGKIFYTIIDWSRTMRGPMNVIGWGLGIDSKSGPDEAIDEALLMLRPYPPAGDPWWNIDETARHVDDDLRGYELSHRGEIPLRITSVRRPSESGRQTA